MQGNQNNQYILEKEEQGQKTHFMIPKLTTKFQ